MAVTDDYAPIRTALRRFFDHEPDFRWAGEAADSDEAVRLVMTHHVDLMLLDLAMPGAGGFLVLPQLRAAAPHLRVIVFSAYPASVYARRAIALGASNYIEKGVGLDVLEATIRTAMAHPVPPVISGWV